MCRSVRGSRSWLLLPFTTTATLFGFFSFLFGGVQLLAFTIKFSFSNLWHQTLNLLIDRIKQVFKKTLTFFLVLNSRILLTIGAKAYAIFGTLHSFQMFHPSCINSLKRNPSDCRKKVFFVKCFQLFFDNILE